MKLQISHDTTYHYEEPAILIVQALRMWPAPSDAQTVKNWRVEVNGVQLRQSCSDGFGNPVATHSIDQPVDSVQLSVRAVVETRNCHGVHGNTIEPLPPMFYLASTPLTAASPAISRLAAATNADDDALTRLHALSNAVRDHVDYRPAHTHSETVAADAFEKGAGVCQDHAHILISAARVLGYPARYVSGYLCPMDADSEAASHAWAEIYVDSLGWVGFDAANRVSPDEHYVRMACGRDYRDAAPVRGVRIGGIEETLEVQVSIIDASQQAQ